MSEHNIEVPPSTNPSRSGHLPINGLSVYYEVYGEIGGTRGRSWPPECELQCDPATLRVAHHIRAIDQQRPHPELVDKLVPMSATYRWDGLYPSVLEGIKGLDAAAFAGTPVETAFMRHTPTPRRSRPTWRR